MDIIQRNLFRLLRSGAFKSEEQIEPMSVYKWTRLHQLAVRHDVASFAYQGLQRCQSQFFLHLTQQQWADWKESAAKTTSEETYANDEDDKFLRPDQLTNPLLNHRLQDILDDEHSDTTTRRLLLNMIRIVRHVLNEGMPVRQLLDMGLFLRTNGNRVDFITLEKWLRDLRLQQMSLLEGEFLVLLFGFKPDEMPFLQEKTDKRIERIAQELIEFTNTRSQNWYFSQGSDSIFVHNSNTSAMFSHVRRSARYFRYYPSESLTNFFASFIHSLSHIEE